MNFEEAIGAHQKWKARLRMQLSGTATETLRPEEVAKEDLCVLGQWIRGQGGRTFAGKPEFTEVAAVHAEFHQIAAQVLRLAQSGNAIVAERLLEGEFFAASSRVVTALTKCRNACKL